MKTYKLFILCSLSLLLFSCSSEVALQKKTDVSLLQLPTQKIEISNYQKTGIDFIVTPITPTSIQRAKVISSDSIKSKNDSVYAYEISTKYPNEDAPVLTELIIKPNEDGTMTSTHFIDNYELATLKFDKQGKLVGVTIPEDNDPGISYARGIYLSKQKLTYSCVSAEYKRLKKLAESDMVNDWICTITFPICGTMMVMAGVEACR
jgi:hypothetical protein